MPGANTFAYTMGVSLPTAVSDMLMVNLRAFAVVILDIARPRSSARRTSPWAFTSATGAVG